MKQFLIKISYTVLPVWLLLVGMATYLWVTDDNSGDLMRLGLIDGGPEYTDSILATDVLREVEYASQNNDSLLLLDTCDVVVIGDSFSHGGGVGKQGDFVNYLAHDSGRRVVVFTPADNAQLAPMQVAYDALRLGVIDSSRVKNLVVQEVERNIVARHSAFVSNHTSLPRPEDASGASAAPAQPEEASPLLRVKDFVFYHFFGANPIYKARLSRPMFGGKEPDVLYFYNEDVKSGCDITPDQRQAIEYCYRLLISMARQRGVNLVIVIACDKYDMYQDMIVDNPYPPKALNEDIARWMAPELDRFVLAKQVLHPLVEQGVRDVYLFNDTHWSPASSRLVAREVISKLK
ncbi:MAG: hypothetical protein IJV11_08280 [Muribaculaceae bacterium]|nr:hypothetical protein [Muribaculaceae bacterium]